MDKDSKNNMMDDNSRQYFIPAEEAGYSEEDFIVDETFYDELYKMYKDECHQADSLNPKFSIEKHEKVNYGSDTLACFGRVGLFRWYSLSVYFSESVHKIDEEKKHFNIIHSFTAADILEGPGEHLSQAINNTPELVNLLRNPVVANTSQVYKNTNYSVLEMEQHLRGFIGCFDFDVIYKDGNKIMIKKENVKEKDIIMPFIYATTELLDLFGRLAKRLCACGANTVVGIFATRLVPTLDGKTGTIPSEDRVQSFAPRLRIMPYKDKTEDQ